MALPDYLRALRRWWRIPVLLTVVTVLTTGALTVLSRPSYTATSLIFASSPSNTTARSVTFTQVVTSNTLASRAASQVAKGASADDLARHIRISIVGPNLYSVAVTADGPQRAVQLTAAVAGEAVVLYRDLAAQAADVSADAALLKAQDALRQAYVEAVTARLNFQVQHPNAFKTGAPITDVTVAARALQLTLQEQTAATAYSAVLAEVSRKGIDQITQARDYNAFILDQPVARSNPDARLPQVLFAGAIALLVGIGLVLLVDHFASKPVGTPEVVEEMIGAPVIGIIPRAAPSTTRADRGGTR